MSKVDADPQSLTRKITEEQVPSHFMVQKMTPYSGLGEHKTHLNAFRAQMLISGVTDVIRCKMFVVILIKTTLQWFIRIPNNTIDSFKTISHIFLQKISANQIKPLKMADLFDIRQKEGKSL